MARIRNIKPEFFEDTTIAELSRDARYLYLALFCWMDKKGIMEDNIKFIRAKVHPYDKDVSEKAVDKWVTELIHLKRLFRFMHEGKSYLYCPKFSLHQRFHKDEVEKYGISDEILASVLSAPLQHGADTTTAPPQHGAKSPDILKSEIGDLENGGARNLSPSRGRDAVFDFEGLYKLYPRKTGKAAGLEFCEKKIKTAEDYAALESAIKRFTAFHVKNRTEDRYIPYFSSFMGESNEWKDWLDPETGTVPRDSPAVEKIVIGYTESGLSVYG